MEGIERYVEMAHRLSALPPSGAAAALSSDSPAMELSSTEEAEEAAAAAVELAIEERLERRTEREARHVLFDDLQRGWSDTTFGAERLRLEALDEDDAQTQHEPEVIGVEDRADGLVLGPGRPLSVCMSVAVVTDVSLRECCVLASSECSIWFLCPSSFGSARVSCPGLRF